ncbi:DUF1192 domain-containing protein [Rhodobium gokarnense]|uniref:Uncharacterized small protein (DUF1192 family) n=1 Tax=Rhodobium gokarnense TaxID=364296 RepID=A0ABT3H6Z4_9HYPH|nr:DUF1192 domain-containing protein [Rhodobium gokarnense]MCW2306159.1 uncharacterized small protein (DUF1192 family) [Rhodobium gokarnense]
MFFDDEGPAKAPRAGHRVGEDISTLSVAELTERIGELEAEIGRLKDAILAREATRSAADSVFKS